MTSKITKIAAIVVMGLIINLTGTRQADAQFSKAVVLLRGTVRTDKGKAHSVKVSVRAAGDRALEITNSKSNSESGAYLVVLQANKKYWVHLEGDDILTKDELIETPSTSKTVQMDKDFAVTTISVAKSLVKAGMQ
ncbi:MAG: hypothetical protein Q8916_03325 [Bacteroidota bacterium]|nr:hypothetical protein [Bacteroidota bacterium]MDP4229420.1 hypothetical protein [Bacteroidota bacterium]MDP4235944.1 hypothetical protein [Bacteroidota bacterium]